MRGASNGDNCLSRTRTTSLGPSRAFILSLDRRSILAEHPELELFLPTSMDGLKRFRATVIRPLLEGGNTSSSANTALCVKSPPACSLFSQRAAHPRRAPRSSQACCVRRPLCVQTEFFDPRIGSHECNGRGAVRYADGDGDCHHLWGVGFVHLLWVVLVVRSANLIGCLHPELHGDVPEASLRGATSRDTLLLPAGAAHHPFHPKPIGEPVESVGGGAAAHLLHHLLLRLHAVGCDHHSRRHTPQSRALGEKC